jgi:phospholipase C
VGGPHRVVRLTLANQGASRVTYTLTRNDFHGRTQTVPVGSRPVTVDWPANVDGFCDLIITASTSDGFTRKYAGRIA